MCHFVWHYGFFFIPLLIGERAAKKIKKFFFAQIFFFLVVDGVKTWHNFSWFVKTLFLSSSIEIYPLVYINWRMLLYHNVRKSNFFFICQKSIDKNREKNCSHMRPTWQLFLYNRLASDFVPMLIVLESDVFSGFCVHINYLCHCSFHLLLFWQGYQYMDQIWRE